MEIKIVVTQREPVEIDAQRLQAVQEMWSELLVQAVLAAPNGGTPPDAAQPPSSKAVKSP